MSAKTEPLRPGSRVRVVTLGKHGIVEEGPNRKGQYLVSVGALSIWTSQSDLEALKPGKASKKRKQTHRPVPGAAAVLSVDLHGLTKDQAEYAIEELLDRALRTGCDRLEIIHGIGSGAVKTAAHKYLAASRHVASFKLDDANPGTTWAYL